jgi:uncharacterized RDD family membrane protein YckC
MAAAGEEPASGEALEPAGLVTRLLADAVDALVLAALFLGLRLGLAALGAVLVVSPRFVHVLGLGIRWVASVLLVPAYHVLFWSIAGRTPGKWLLGLRIVSRGGGSIRPGQALLRFVGLTISIAPLLAGVFAMLFDRKRRAWHDRIAGTLVVYDRTPAAPRVRVRLSPAADPPVTSPSRSSSSEARSASRPTAAPP